MPWLRVGRQSSRFCRRCQSSSGGWCFYRRLLRPPPEPDRFRRPSEKTFRAVLSRLDPHGSWPISLRIRSCTRYIRSRVMARNPASSTSSTTA
ncbi:hypothetical protein I551_2444 [Mycobacterium ulcerans str. Harvey]|uniref:Uncharacterized protein n=1 Tax=Mycobacterium ulcerans str. Harvey TaxID=1299332 RepID=A0ABP3AIM0_MYCUL|nr:hypothetical protein I551_2444 [Mycobacterium ulcerans str. Harvey]